MIIKWFKCFKREEMKLSIILLFVSFISFCKAESNSKPHVLFIPREQEPGDDSRTPSKTIVISGVSDQMAKEQPQHVMRAVVNAVQSQFKQDIANGVFKEPNVTGLDVPDVFFSEPVREINDQQSIQQQQDSSVRLSPEVVQRVYKLPIVTRMISREEETDNSTKDVNTNSLKKTVPNVWRSPIPFMYNSCPMHAMNRNRANDKKMKSYRRKESTNEGQVLPAHPFFMSLMPSLPDPEALHNLDSKVKLPEAILMAITRQIKPEIQLPLKSHNILRPHLPLMMALLRKNHERPEQELPFNPFLGLLSKLLQKPITPKGRFDFLSGREPTHEEKVEKPINNYNFNVNFTINNNNYAKKESNPFLKNPMPFPFLRTLY